MFGFSREVAREVTHPEWPSRVPLRMSCSVIFTMLLNRFATSNLHEISKNILRGRDRLSDAPKPTSANRVLARLRRSSLQFTLSSRRTATGVNSYPSLNS
jgi:hypothetical protein